MKRLLAYLVVIFILGLTFNINANARYIYMETEGWFNLENHKNLEDFLEDFYKQKKYWHYPIEKNFPLKVRGYHNVSDKSTCKDLISYSIKRYGKNIYRICIDERGKDGELYKKLLKYSKKDMCFFYTRKSEALGKFCMRYISKKYFVKYANFYGTDLKFGKNTDVQIAKAESDKSSVDKAKIEQEKKKIAEEKRKIEKEKRKIAEAKKKQEEEERKRKEANAKLYVIGSGTGFFVSSAGHAVSNEHVVGICKKVATKIEGEKLFFNILKTDKVNDIGLIKGDYKSSTFLNIKSDGAEFGEDIVAFGYPLSDKLSSSVKLSRGIVSSLSGPNDNYSEIQIDAAIQPGNSGGPVLNMEGQVVGIASSGLNKVLMLLDEDQPYIPENINFAVAAPTLLNFLKANGVSTKSEALEIKNTKELAKIGRPATIQLFCLNTKAKYDELKKKKKHNNVLLEKVVELN